MTINYNKSEILSFFELNDYQQKEVKKNYDYDSIEEDSFIIYNFKQSSLNNEEIIPLSMFMRCDNNKFTHGVFRTSAFDGYFITINRTGEECVIARKSF